LTEVQVPGGRVYTMRHGSLKVDVRYTVVDWIEVA
jgi:hypothetical protein